jgi:hypothetical protein
VTAEAGPASSSTGHRFLLLDFSGIRDPAVALELASMLIVGAVVAARYRKPAAAT